MEKQKHLFLNSVGLHLRGLAFAKAADDCNTSLTAFGRRLLDLSWAFHSNRLTEQQLVALSDELVECLDAFCQRIESASNDLPLPTRDELLSALYGFIDLAERFDQMPHTLLTKEVSKLERSLRSVQISVRLQSVA